MKQMIDFLEVVTQIRLGWSFDSKPTLNLVIPNCFYLKNFSSRDQKSAHIHHSADLFSAILDEKLVFKVSPVCKVACFLSPKDFHSWSTQGFAFAADFSETIVPELKNFASHLPVLETSITVKRQLSSQDTPVKKPKVVDFSAPYKDTESESDQSAEFESERTIFEEAREYLQFITDKSNQSSWKSTDPIQFWKSHSDKFPILFQAAKFYLAIPATSVSSERLFASVWFTVNTLRSSLSSETVQQLQFVNKNCEFLDITSGHLRELITKALSEISKKNVSISLK